MKFWELNNAVKDEMRLDPGLVTDGERVRFFNDCMSEIAALQLVELTKTDLAVISQYPAVPVGLEKVRSLYWNNIKLIVLRPDRDMDSAGNPVGYILEADAIRLWPKPASSGSLRWTYTGTPTDCTEAMTTDETSVISPGLPTSWHSLLIEYACYRSHRKNGNVLMSGQYKKAFDLGMSTNIRAYVSKLNSQVVDNSRPEDTGGDFYGFN